VQVLRTHFHDFMLGVHMKLRTYKGDTDPLLRVADSIAKVRLLS
jgi:cell division protein ZapE